MLLHETYNMGLQDNILIREGIRAFQQRLPAGWSLNQQRSAPGPIDALAELAAPDHRTTSIAIEARVRLEPKGVSSLVEATRDARARGPLIVVGRYLSEATRARLRDGEVSYLDLTGNARIVVAEPGLYIETQGASEDPDRQERPVRSLRGSKVGRIVRTLVDRKRPPGVRELAVMTKIDAGYVSRVLAFLDSEALVTRVGRGRMQSVDWSALLRRWAKDAPVESRGQARAYLEPRGLEALEARLRNLDDRYVISGSLAAAAFAPVAPARLATIWIRDPEQAAKRLALRSAEVGANTVLIEPNDEGVFDGAAKRDGLWYAAPSQVAADLLTSPGRGPAEGEDLIGWMRANEESWRQ
ncbi:MAG: hypothetical protein IT370_09030 [Deltaproteobacteria bacterium]|nr:hypothetical protein [Deltaproteobacteria bacterium]